jgi:hypothetical protein
MKEGTRATLTYASLPATLTGITRPRILGALLLCLLALLPLTGWSRSIILEGEVATGWNRLFGEARYHWDFLEPPLDLAGATTLGLYNPEGGQPLPITADTPNDAVLATIVDPYLERLFPPFKAGLTHPDAANVPLREVGTWVTGDLSRRATLAPQPAAPIVSLPLADPDVAGPITKGDWFAASGQMVVTCKEATNRVKIRVRHLIPNRLYTVWGMWYSADGQIVPKPFGGLPNAYVTDNHGNGMFERNLGFCPTGAALLGIEGSRLLSVISQLHSDHALYGAVWAPLFVGFPPGTVQHVQLEWNFPGTGVHLVH